MRDNRPEVIVDFGKRIELTDPNIERKDYTKFLEAKLTEICDEQFRNISQGNIDDYKILFKQHLKWYRRIEQRLKELTYRTFLKCKF